MTGYLQRLAASVGSRPSRIRPVVDPLYAGGAGRFGAEAGAGELALEEESVLVDSLARQEPDTNRLPHEAIEPTRDSGDRRAPGPVVEPTRAGPPAPLVAIPPSLRPGAQTRRLSRLLRKRERVSRLKSALGRAWRRDWSAGRRSSAGLRSDPTRIACRRSSAGRRFDRGGARQVRGREARCEWWAARDGARRDSHQHRPGGGHRRAAAVAARATAQ